MIDLSRTKLLVLDLDNTLCDTFHALTIRQWHRVADGFAKMGRKDIAKALRSKPGKQSFVSALDDLRLSAAQKRFAVRLYDKNPIARLKLFPDAKPLIGVPCRKVLLTRGDAALQQRKIRHLGIGKSFEDVIFVGTFERKLPALRKLLHDKFLHPKQMLVIGDRLEEEIADAHSLGIPTVLVRRPDWPVKKTDTKPDMVVRDLRVLAKVLRNAQRRP